MSARIFNARDASKRGCDGPQSGFTVLEMVVVLAIVVILVAMLVPAAITFLESQRAQHTADDLDALRTAIVGDPKKDDFGYLGDVGSYPASLIDLVNATSTIGWKGPYVIDVRIANGTLIDRFGGTIEYFNQILSSADPDCVGLISKGPDLSSSNALPNPNLASACGGLIPPATYIADVLNQDNILRPDFVENLSLLGYQPVGTLAYKVLSNDTDPRQLRPGCPALNTMTVTSISRESSDKIALPFNPGLTADLVQGVYDVVFTSPEAPTPVWRERASIVPSATLTKTVTLNVDSGSTPTYTLRVLNVATGVTLQVFASGVSQGTAPSGGMGTFTDFPGMNGCAPIEIQNQTDGGTLVDEFIMPHMGGFTYPPPSCAVGAGFCTANFTKAFASFGAVTFPPSTVEICVTNTGPTSRTLTLLENGLPRGTVKAFGSSKRKCFRLTQGSLYTVVNEAGAAVSGTAVVTTGLDLIL